MTTPDTAVAIFSADWCAEASRLYATDVQPFIKDPPNFNYTAEFRLIDGPGCQFATEGSRLVWWKAGTDHLAEPATFILQAKEEHWSKVMRGEMDPVPAIAAKRLHLVAGPMDVIIKEVDALKRMIVSWGAIGTGD